MRLEITPTPGPERGDGRCRNTTGHGCLPVSFGVVNNRRLPYESAVERGEKYLCVFVGCGIQRRHKSEIARHYRDAHELDVDMRTHPLPEQCCEPVEE